MRKIITSKFFVASLAALALFATSIEAARSASNSCSVADWASDGGYCALLDNTLHAEFMLSSGQEAQWQTLRTQHDALHAALADTIAVEDGGPTSLLGRPLLRRDTPAAMADYGRNKLAFLTQLTASQHSTLAAAVRTRQHVLADLQEKVILHKLML